MKFNLRDLLWLTFVVALLVTWWLRDREQLAARLELERQRRELARQKAELTGEVQLLGAVSRSLSKTNDLLQGQLLEAYLSKLAPPATGEPVDIEPFKWEPQTLEFRLPDATQPIPDL